MFINYVIYLSTKIKCKDGSSYFYKNQKYRRLEKRRNFSLVSRYSLKFTRCSLLVVKSLVTRCKLRSLLVAEVARSKNSLVTRCKIRWLLVAEVARSKYSLVTRCKLCLLLAATSHLLLNAKNHSSHGKTITSP